MIKRELASVLLSEAAKMPVVTVLGPRQSGKTTLVRNAFPDREYINLERPDRRAVAREDPLGFLEGIGRNAILDEVQRTPELLSYIQVAVDDEDRPGRFILTGSSDFLLMESISQTLAGRTSVLRLLPFSMSELLGRPAFDPEAAATAATAPLGGTDSPPIPDKWDCLWRGFYPRIHDKQLKASRWLADYHRTYVERDVREVLNIQDMDGFERFVRLAAARTGCELNLTELAADAGISQPTAKSWLTALRVGSLVVLLPPHHRNYRKRLRKRPKLHFLDVGLVCYLLGINEASVLANHPLRGAIFESFVVAELVKLFANQGQEAPLFHWRDATGHEIDVLIDLGTKQIPVEIKSGVTVASDALDSLLWWLKLSGNSNDTGLLVHGGTDQGRRQDVSILPWFLV